MPTLYELPLTTLSGKPASLADYAGKVLLIVNVASRCALTPQYVALERLYQTYKDRGLVVLGFPSNDFAGQEPGTDAEIATFCSIDSPVTFPMFSKIAVTGEDQHPLFRELTSTMPQHEADNVDFRFQIDNYLSGEGLPMSLPLPAILWNFEKFLVARDGTLIKRFSPDVTPDSPRLLQAVEKALASAS